MNFLGKTSVIGQFLRYIAVGGISFVVDAGVLFMTEPLAGHLIGAAIAFVVGLVVNFILSKLFVFAKASVNPKVEFLTYVLIGLVGLGLTELLMYTLTDWLGFYFMFSKVITAAIVLAWNFAARKMILYRRG